MHKGNEPEVFKSKFKNWDTVLKVDHRRADLKSIKSKGNLLRSSRPGSVASTPVKQGKGGMATAGQSTPSTGVPKSKQLSRKGSIRDLKMQRLASTANLETVTPPKVLAANES